MNNQAKVDRYRRLLRQAKAELRIAVEYQEEPVGQADYTDWLIGWLEWGLDVTGNEDLRWFTEEVYSAAKQVPINALPKKLEELVVEYFVNVMKTDLPSPFQNFVLHGLYDLIDWNDVAFAVAEKAREQLQLN